MSAPASATPADPPAPARDARRLSAHTSSDTPPPSNANDKLRSGVKKVALGGTLGKNKKDKEGARTHHQTDEKTLARLEEYDWSHGTGLITASHRKFHTFYVG